MATFIREDDAAEDVASADIAQARNSDPVLAARYGHTRKEASRLRLLGWVTAALFVVVFAVWVIWAGLDGSPAIEVQDIGHSFPSEDTVSVTFNITMPRGESATCAVQALNESFAIVGWKIVSIPASDLRTRGFTELLRTSEPSTTGLIYRCWSA